MANPPSFSTPLLAAELAATTYPEWLNTPPHLVHPGAPYSQVALAQASPYMPALSSYPPGFTTISHLIDPGVPYERITAQPQSAHPGAPHSQMALPQTWLQMTSPGVYSQQFTVPCQSVNVGPVAPSQPMYLSHPQFPAAPQPIQISGPTQFVDANGVPVTPPPQFNTAPITSPQQFAMATNALALGAPQRLQANKVTPIHQNSTASSVARYRWKLENRLSEFKGLSLEIAGDEDINLRELRNLSRDLEDVTDGIEDCFAEWQELIDADHHNYADDENSVGKELALAQRAQKDVQQAIEDLEERLRRQQKPAYPQSPCNSGNRTPQAGASSPRKSEPAGMHEDLIIRTLPSRAVSSKPLTHPAATQRNAHRPASVNDSGRAQYVTEQITPDPPCFQYRHYGILGLAVVRREGRRYHHRFFDPGSARHHRHSHRPSFAFFFLDCTDDTASDFTFDVAIDSMSFFDITFDLTCIGAAAPLDPMPHFDTALNGMCIFAAALDPLSLLDADSMHRLDPAFDLTCIFDAALDPLGIFAAALDSMSRVDAAFDFGGVFDTALDPAASLFDAALDSTPLFDTDLDFMSRGEAAFDFLGAFDAALALVGVFDAASDSVCVFDTAYISMPSVDEALDSICIFAAALDPMSSFDAVLDSTPHVDAALVSTPHVDAALVSMLRFDAAVAATVDFACVFYAACANTLHSPSPRPRFARHCHDRRQPRQRPPANHQPVAASFHYLIVWFQRHPDRQRRLRPRSRRPPAGVSSIVPTIITPPLPLPMLVWKGTIGSPGADRL
uniref:Ribonuclease H n=1 Tax=Panagrellus redivivus TaxID=6233 RepID=A0A7E4WBG7_PANRE